MPGTSAVIRNTPALDPAYRPTRWPTPQALLTGSARQSRSWQLSRAWAQVAILRQVRYVGSRLCPGHNLRVGRGYAEFPCSGETLGRWAPRRVDGQ
jgi:hypothetical protein